ncbi:O-antigen ligase family protein [Undibacterium sp. Ren11W]|uniref:O-antigen ligase family protein n=1 Tax=Undibacterium sp. Ren11W TaxID=3413045 RepID=UPI003BF26DC0
MMSALYPSPTKTKGEPIAWALTLVFSAMLLGNNLFTKVTLLLCLSYFGFKNMRVMPEIFSALRFNPGLMLFQLWAASSVFWSVVPKVTRDIVFVQTAFFCLCVLMARYAIGKDLIKSLKLAAFFVITVIVLFALAYPKNAVSPSGFKAFYVNKNNLGLVMSVCLVIILYSSKLKWLDYGFATIAFTLLLLSRSKTSLGLLLFIVVISLLLHLLKKLHGQLSSFAKGMLALCGRGLLVCVYGFIILMVLYRDTIASYLIKLLPYEFLTGRGELWVTVLKRAEIDLLHGLGPGSFWGAGRLSEIAQTSLLTKYPLWIEKLGSADGGYIDLIGALGFVGLAILFCTFVSNYRRLMMIATAPISGMLIALITLFVFHNITETTVYHSTNFLWFLYLFLSFYLIFFSNINIAKQVAEVEVRTEILAHPELRRCYE